MIGFLLELMAIDACFRAAANQRVYRRLQNAKACGETFAVWAQANPHHALTQRVEAELLAVKHNLRMDANEKGWAVVVVAENAYTLLAEITDPRPWALQTPTALALRQKAKRQRGCLWTITLVPLAAVALFFLAAVVTGLVQLAMHHMH